ncbi:fumarylacetoacetase [Gracilimonas sediminicola]|uniref:fumarylacetoacetase n=1 Tax=Gracilimonas sediminicola TaxID=2952158 RepID=A0A9X2RFT7_9BACT|nr:fumarylacetoacetase [Gracilimonas sediminicola]MCP9291118.1 fumarylacetoacetase [Gracilimonas sediminicola]
MLKSFIEVDADSHFPIQNLPYGAYETEQGEIHLCSAIGEYIIDLFALDEEGLFDGPVLNNQYAFQDSTLNYFMSLGKSAWTEARETLQSLLYANNETLRDDALLRQRVFKKRDDVRLVMPVQIGDYTDFYSSEQHARNVGSMFRDPDNALLPNWKHLPVGYHGRASSIVLSGTDIHRPKGQTKPDNTDQPIFGPSQKLDFELEMGFLTGSGNKLGHNIPVQEAEDHIFGLVLVNDWSARDIQKWEYQPLGPFLAKSWATSVSPWIITMEALEPFRTVCPQQDHKPLDYLNQPDRTTFDIQLDVFLKTENQSKPHRICSTNFKHLYWTMAQQLAHQTVSGCNVKPGDLYASGTISGPEADSYGSMLELTRNGTHPLTLPSGEGRSFLEDGDEVIMSGFAQGEGFKVGFGEVTGKILPAIK